MTLVKIIPFYSYRCEMLHRITIRLILIELDMTERLSLSLWGFPSGSAGKESACDVGRPGFDPWVGKVLWRREWLPTPVFWPGEFHGLSSPWASPGQNTGVGSFSLPQGTFPTQGSNPGLPHCRQILYQLSHHGSPIHHWSLFKYSHCGI